MSIAEIVADESLQCRAKIDTKVVKEYAHWMNESIEFSAIVVFEIDGKLFLADGFHRFNAAKLAGLEFIWGYKLRGTRADALRYSIKANATHGLRFTNKDKRHAVELMLLLSPDMSSRALAGLCRVSGPFVEKVRGELQTDCSSTTRKGQDGRTRKMPKKKSKQAAADTGTRRPTDATEPKPDKPANTGGENKSAEDAEPSKAAKDDARGAEQEQTQRTKPLVFGNREVPFKQWIKQLQQISNICDNSGKKQEAINLLAKIQNELRDWEENQIYCKTNAEADRRPLPSRG